MPAKRYFVNLSEEEKEELQTLISGGESRARVQTRARVLLAGSDNNMSFIPPENGSESGEARLYVMTESSTTEDTLFANLFPGVEYTGGVFGEDVKASKTKSVFVGKQLIVEKVEFPQELDAVTGGTMKIKVSTKDKNVTEPLVGANVSLKVAGGKAEVSTGTTNTDGEFSTAINLIECSSGVEVTATVTAQIDGKEQTKELVMETQSGMGLTVSPAFVRLDPRESQSFTTMLEDAGCEDTIFWQAEKGTIDENGRYLAPDEEGIEDTITATLFRDDGHLQATASVNVGDAPEVVGGFYYLPLEYDKYRGIIKPKYAYNVIQEGNDVFISQNRFKSANWCSSGYAWTSTKNYKIDLKNNRVTHITNPAKNYDTRCGNVYLTPSSRNLVDIFYDYNGDGGHWFSEDYTKVSGGGVWINEDARKQFMFTKNGLTHYIFEEAHKAQKVNIPLHIFYLNHSSN